MDKPRDIALLVYDGCMGTEVFAVADLLLIANHLAAAMAVTAQPPFRVRLVSAGATQVTLAGGFAVAAGRMGAQPDLLVVPGLEVSRFGQWDEKLAPLAAQLSLLRREARRGTPIAAICIGTFLLGEAGLLQGHRVTTAWPFGAEFSARYPGTQLEAGAVLVHDQPFITTGAVSSAFDFAIHLVRRELGEKVARATGRMALVNGQRPSQRPYVDNALIPAEAQPFAHKVNAWLAKRLEQPYQLAALAQAFHVSGRTLLRRYTGETGLSPLTWLQQARVDKARLLLERSGMSTAEVVEAVGYSDHATFSRLFARQVGESPAQYRRRSRAAAAPARPRWEP